MKRTPPMLPYVLAAFVLGFAASRDASAVDVGDKPVLDFQAVDGTKVSSDALRGKTVARAIY